jgi:hypothetical protein
LAVPDFEGFNKVASKRLSYLKIRARSRSFQQITELNQEDEETDDIMSSDSFYGVGVVGQFFLFTPDDYSITEDFIEVRKLFEDTLSPTVVYLVKDAQSGKTMVKKSILKSKLLSDSVKESAERE